MDSLIQLIENANPYAVMVFLTILMLTLLGSIMRIAAKLIPIMELMGVRAQRALDELVQLNQKMQKTMDLIIERQEQHAQEISKISQRVNDLANQLSQRTESPFQKFLRRIRSRRSAECPPTS